MLPKVKEAFMMEKAYQEEIGLTCNVVVDGYTDFVFINCFGGVQHQGTLNKALRRIIRDCNYEVLDKGKEDPVLLPKFSNHSLRHTFTTRMCEAGVNIKAMQDILGHADAETTLQIYTDATKDLKKAEMINFEDYFKAQKMKQTGTGRTYTIKELASYSFLLEHFYIVDETTSMTKQELNGIKLVKTDLSAIGNRLWKQNNT